MGGAYPAKRHADFAHETVAAILLDDGGPGPGSVFCHTERLSDEMLDFAVRAFETCAAYKAFCEVHHKDTCVQIIDGDSCEPLPTPVAPPASTDEAFESLVKQIDARDRQERDSVRERWRLRLREITGLLDEVGGL